MNNTISPISKTKIYKPNINSNICQVIKSGGVSFGGASNIRKNLVNKYLVDGFAPLNSLKMLKTRAKFFLYYMMNKKAQDAFYNKLIGIKSGSPEYTYAFQKICKQIAIGKEIEINIESGLLKKLAASDESSIFVINHDNVVDDNALLAFFNYLLSKEYVAANKIVSCPKSKIITTETILKEQGPKMRKLYEKFGLVSVDSRLLKNKKAKSNSDNLSPIKQEFIQNKANIFIFPEGRMSKFPELEIENKFQTGIAKMIQSAAIFKDKVKVVPLGFSYRDNVGAIYIGNPVYFKKNGDELMVSISNATSKFASEDYLKFFQNKKVGEDFQVITSNGSPLKNKELPDYVSGILCENIKICKKEAESSLANKVENNEILKM